MRSEDITGKSHWDWVYGNAEPACGKGWRPTTYEELCIWQMLSGQIKKGRPQNILEVGCGNSTWLPYLGACTGAAVTGIDYCEDGCDLARRNLLACGVAGRVVCGDIFALDPAETGTFDLVYSLGLVEHFQNPEAVIDRLGRFVVPGGVMVTEVPNLLSVHGAMAHIYQPRLLAKHKLLRLEDLISGYRRSGFDDIAAEALGVFSMGIVAWGIDPRFPRLDPILLPAVELARRASDRVLRRLGSFRGVRPLAPFLYVAGTRR